MSKELLLEIGTEEIPAGFIQPALEQIKELTQKMLGNKRIKYEGIQVFGTPRRLVLYIDKIDEKQEDIKKEIVGPPKERAYDKDNLPTKAAIGFAKGQGVGVDDLKIKKTERGEYICAVKEEKGVESKNILETLLPKLITDISFPKSMRWGDSELKFVRPIHWILALLGGEVVDFVLDGIKSGSCSCGHRFLSPGIFEVKDFKTYLQKTKDAFVIIDQSERKDLIKNQIERAAKDNGGTVLEDENLLDTVVNLIEYPVAVCGSFDKEYLELPQEILITSMREHQKYFSIIDENGSILPHFIAISNLLAEDMDIIRSGNEKVLKARLADAKFFYKEDSKSPLADRLDDLKRVVFQEKLGTSYEKVSRFSELSRYLSRKLNADSDIVVRAAQLCKADLVTGMVGEFPELQGVMGREYALLSGENPLVAKAIYEHYLPRFAGDSLPATIAGSIVSMADKIDTITGCFGIGLIPTGSEDPYALRRQALGIINIIIQKEYRLSLKELIKQAVKQLEGKIVRDADEVEDDVLQFMQQRMYHQLLAEGLRYDIVEAVLYHQFDDIRDCYQRIKALSTFKDKSEFEPLTTAFKRVIKIIPDENMGEINTKYFEEEAEKELYKVFKDLEKEVEKNIKEENYYDALQKIANLRPLVDNFFDQVMVMVEDKKLKQNRLALLSAIGQLFSQIADFSRIVG